MLHESKTAANVVKIISFLQHFFLPARGILKASDEFTTCLGLGKGTAVARNQQHLFACCHLCVLKRREGAGSSDVTAGWMIMVLLEDLREVPAVCVTPPFTPIQVGWWPGPGVPAQLGLSTTSQRGGERRCPCWSPRDSLASNVPRQPVCHILLAPCLPSFRETWDSHCQHAGLVWGQEIFFFLS